MGVSMTRVLLALIVLSSTALASGCNAKCSNTCRFANDGVCDDPGPCAFGTDCSDCGWRSSGPGGGILVEELGGAIARGARNSPDPIRPATTTGQEPRITGGRIYQEDGGDTMVIEIDYIGPVQPETLLLEFGDTVLAFALEVAASGDISDLACRVAEMQGYPCTDACRAACSCVSCSNSSQEVGIHGGCAVNCSIYSAMGQIPGPIYSSEEDLAYKVYYGYMGVDGILDTYPSCSGSMCTVTTGGTMQARASFGMVGVDYGPALNSITTNSRAQLTSPPSPISSVGIRSEPFPTGMLDTSRACDPARCM